MTMEKERKLRDHLHRGDALLAEGRLQEAEEEYQAALEMDPASSDAHYKLGNLYLEMGRTEEVLRELALCGGEGEGEWGVDLSSDGLDLSLEELGEAFPPTEEEGRAFPSDMADTPEDVQKILGGENLEVSPEDWGSFPSVQEGDGKRKEAAALPCQSPPPDIAKDPWLAGEEDLEWTPREDQGRPQEAEEEYGAAAALQELISPSEGLDLFPIGEEETAFSMLEDDLVRPPAEGWKDLESLLDIRADADLPGSFPNAQEEDRETPPDEGPPVGLVEDGWPAGEETSLKKRAVKTNGEPQEDLRQVPGDGVGIESMGRPEEVPILVSEGDGPGKAAASQIPRRGSWRHLFLGVLLGMILGAALTYLGLVLLFGYPGRADRPVIRAGEGSSPPSEGAKMPPRGGPQSTPQAPVRPPLALPLPSPSPPAAGASEKESASPSEGASERPASQPAPSSGTAPAGDMRTDRKDQKPLLGWLKVSVSPWADVYLDGRRVGRATGESPLDIRNVSPGRRRLRLVNSELEASWNGWVRIKPGETRQISHSFPPQLGTLMVNVDPWGWVYVDGKESGQTPLTVKLPAGRHQVRIVRQGVPDVLLRVDISPNETKSLSIP